jgi:hypothetical protein
MPIDVASSIKFTATDTEPTSDKGRLYYDDSEAQLKHYDGDDWLRVNQTLNYDRPGDGQYAADAYTKLLIHSNTTNGSTTFVDSGATDHTITRTGAVHSTTQNKIGATSIYFDGDGDTITATGTLGDFNFGSGDFTIDYWQYTSTVTAGDRVYNIGEGDGPPMQHFVRSATDATEHVKIGFGGTTYRLKSSSNDMQDGAWHHWAIVRNGASLTMYVDGEGKDTDAIGGSFDYQTNAPMHLGSYYTNNSSENYTGYLDEFRVSKGIARWTSDFTVY